MVDVQTGGQLGVEASTLNGDDMLYDSAGFGVDGVMREAVFGINRARVTHNWIDGPNEMLFKSTFNLVVQEDGSSAFVQTFRFYVFQSVGFSIEGQLIGNSQTLANATIQVELRNLSQAQTVGSEIDQSVAGLFNQSIDGIQQGNDFFDTQGQFSGQLGQGLYEFSSFSLLSIEEDGGGDTEGSGFIALSLSNVPEPTSMAIWSLVLMGGVGFYRRRNQFP
jgi:hypothetical protein